MPRLPPPGTATASIGVLDLESALARDYDRLADALLERYGRLDGLLHNAGLLGTLTPIEHYDVPTWCRVMHVNVTAAFALTQVLLPALKKSADASIVFTASSVGRHGRAYWGAYAVSKFAIEGLSQVLSAELEGISAVRVNTLNPGPARTAMRRQAYPAENIETVPLPASAHRGVHRAAGSGEPRGQRPGVRRSALRGAGGVGEQRRKLLLSELAELAPPERALEGERAEVRAQHAADERPLTLEELAHFLAARAARHERVPAIGGLAAGCLAALDRKRARRCRARRRGSPAAASRSSAPRTRTPNSLVSECTARCSRAASSPSELTSSSPPSTRGSGTDGDEAPARAPRQPLEQARAWWRLRRRAGAACGRRERLPGRAVTEEHAPLAAAFTGANQPSIEAYPIARCDTRPEGGQPRR